MLNFGQSQKSEFNLFDTDINRDKRVYPNGQNVYHNFGQNVLLDKYDKVCYNIIIGGNSRTRCLANAEFVGGSVWRLPVIGVLIHRRGLK